MDINNFKRWVNSGNADSFSCVYTDQWGVQWFVYGSRLPYEQQYVCSLTLRRDKVAGLTLGAFGLTEDLAVADCIKTIATVGARLTEKLEPDTTPVRMPRFASHRERGAFLRQRAIGRRMAQKDTK